MVRAKRLMLIGLDGAMPNMLEKFADEGSIPNVARLMKEGAFMEALAWPPVDTPTNWVSIVTGARPATHGITSFTVHLPGEPLDVGHSTVDLDATKLCQAEFLWDVAERAGKKCLVLNYLCSWPSTMKKGILIGGPSPQGHPSWILGPPVYFVCNVSDVPSESVRFSVSFHKAKGWRNLSCSSNSCSEVKIPSNFIGPHQMTDRWQKWQLTTQTITGESQPEPCWEPAYYLLVADHTKREPHQVYICREKDVKSAVAKLNVGDWSDWIYEEVPTKKGKVDGGFRFRLNELSPDGNRFELYRTAIHRITGWSSPSYIADNLTRAIGPFASGYETYPISPYFPKYNKIYFEQVSQFADWLADAAKYLKDHQGWDVLFTKIHVHDEICHEVGFEGIDISSALHQPDRYKADWEIMRRQFQICDRWVGRLMEECADENTLVAVISDHGAIPIRQIVSINKLLMDEGLLATKKDEQTGKLTVDWSKTKVYNRSGFPIGYIWVNVKGRDPEGIVEPGEEYETFRDQIITALYNLRDAKTGVCPIALALRKEDAVILGQGGERASDVFFAFKPGYMREAITSFAPDIRLSRQEKQMIAGQIVGRGTHGGFLPTASLGPCTNAAFLVLAGPGVRKGCKRQKPIWLTDVASTVSHLLGIPTPAQSEGALIQDILQQEEI